MNPAIRAIISTFLVIAIAAALYETTKFSATYSSLLYMALAVLSEYVCLVVMQILGFNTLTLLVDGNSRAIYLVFAKTVHLVVVLVAASVLRKNRIALTVKQIAPLLPCLIVSIYIYIVFFEIFPYFEDGFPLMLIIALLGLLYINGIIVFNTQSIKSSAVEIEDQK
jgi:membrane-associated HD superfamily phosphohydrolase